MNYAETDKENSIVEGGAKNENFIVEGAVMLIIKPIKLNDINMSDHFIDWKPGLLRLAIKRHQIMFYTNVIKR